MTAPLHRICRDIRWQVLDEESLSLHHYICFEFGTSKHIAANPTGTNCGWAIRILDRSRLHEILKREELRTTLGFLESASAEEHATGLVEWLSKLADSCMNRRSGSSARKPEPWWSPKIAEMRKAVFKSRRVYQKKRKRHREANYVAELEAFKNRRKELVSEIRNSKEKCWDELLSVNGSGRMGSSIPHCYEEVGTKENYTGNGSTWEV